MAYITTYQSVPNSQWSMSARTIAPFAVGKYFDFLVGLNTDAIFAFGPAGMDGLSPDHFPDRLEFTGGVYIVVGGARTALGATGALPAADGTTRFRAEFRLSAGFDGGSIYPQFIAPAALVPPPAWSAGVLANELFVYVWVKESGDTVYAGSPFIGDATDLRVTHEVSAATTIRVSTQAYLRVGNTVALSGATAIRVATGLAQVAKPKPMTLKLSTQLNLSGGYLRAQPVELHASDKRIMAAKLAAPFCTLTASFTSLDLSNAPPSGGVLTSLPMYVTKAWMFSGQTAEADLASLPISGMGGDHNYGAAVLVASHPVVVAGEISGVYITEYSACIDFWQFRVPQAFVLSESPAAQDAIYLGSTLTPSDSAAVSDNYAFSYSGTLAAQERPAVRDAYQFSKVGQPATVDSNGSETWCLNIDTSASSVYTNYQFNSYFKLDGIQYGVADDGVYQLDGDTDAGMQIESRLHLGTTDFQVNRDKYVAKVYIGGSSTSKLNVAVSADGVVRQYAARMSTAATDVCRVDLGTGVRANYWGFTILNTNGGDFALDNVRVAPVLTLRRI